MNEKKYKQIQKVIILFISAIIILSFFQKSYLLGIISGFVGLLSLFTINQKKFQVDEREKTIREKSAKATYIIFAPTIAIGALLMLIPSRVISPVFAHGEFIFLESLGIVFSYLSLFLISLYIISYCFFSKKFGGNREE